MKKVLFSAIVVLVILFGSQYIVLSKKSVSNPMEYIYHSPIYKVREEVKKELSDYKYYGLPYTSGYNEVERKLASLNENENRNHIFINWFGLFSSGKSKTYYNLWGMLDLYPSYHITLDSLSPELTRIKIESFPQVKTGFKFDTNHGIPYPSSYKIDVVPGTVEEYELIRTIGTDLGEENMPEVIK